jgi:hypothetical protein
MLALALAGMGTASPAAAQLLGDRVEGDRRQCVYVGTDQDATGRYTPRTATVPASQPCPDTAPFRDPNRPAPGNAALIREEPAGGGRSCIYTQGGVTYARFVPATQRCAATPDLLDRALAAGDPGTLGR